MNDKPRQGRRVVIILGAFLLFFSCQTPRQWTGGVPPSGDHLNDDQRMAVHSRYVVTRFEFAKVAIRNGSELQYYTLDSFAPVLDSFDKSLYPQLAKAGREQTYSVYLASVAAALTAQAGFEKFGSRKQIAWGAAAAAAYALRYYFSLSSDSAQKSALSLYWEDLDARLFPQHTSAKLSAGLQFTWTR